MRLLEAEVDGLKNESERVPLGTVAVETVDLTVHSKKSAKKEEKGATKAGHRLLNVPPAVLARESLCALCDVLRSDGCSKDVFNCIEVTIARLAKINGNQNILTSLLVGVVADMADVAASKLKEFSVSLRRSRTQLALIMTQCLHSLQERLERMTQLERPVMLRWPNPVSSRLPSCP